MTLIKGSMREAIDSIYQILTEDEDLLRLLYYKPKSETGIDPFSSTLLNVKDMTDYWEIVNDRIVLAEKVSDLVEKPICRIYISAGRRRGKFESYVLATQEIVTTIYVHEDYEKDMRIARISDRLSKLLVLEHHNGMIGKLEYAGGNPRVAPIQYSKYEHIFEYTASKK